MTEAPINGTAEDLGAILGFTAAARLMSIYGGQLLYIPATATPEHRLEKLLGQSPFSRLCAEYGSETLRVPANADAERLGLIRAVAGLIRAGRRINDIAATIDMSPRQVMRYRVAAEELGLLAMVIRDRAEVE